MRLVSGFAQLKWSVDVEGGSVEVEYGTQQHDDDDDGAGLQSNGGGPTENVARARLCCVLICV